MNVGLIVASGVAVAVGGAFVPRIAYRMSVPLDTPCRASCASCGAAFPPGPRGWIHLGDRCSACAAHLGPAAWLTALTGGLGAAAVAAALGRSWLLPIFLAVVLVGVLLSAIDLACMRLPDVLVLPTFAAAAAGLSVIALARGDAAPLLRALLAAVVLAGIYFVLCIATGGGIGLGDVKLALVLGLLLGWFGWSFVVAGAIVAHLVQGLIAILALLTRRAGARTLIPMGPALMAGAWCAVAVIPVALLALG